MLSFFDSKTPSSKAYVSQGDLPKFVDFSQLPSKKKPFSTILNQPYTHTVQLILPQEIYDLIWKDVEEKIGPVQYSRIIMSLSELLEEDFFNKYFKIGNVLMLSEGRPGIDDRYSFKDGLLRLELAKENYERCGLVGKPIRDAGQKHVKTRFAVEIDLRQPSMLHGKKGFERVVWAFKNVLTHSLTWLFHDFEKKTDSMTYSDEDGSGVTDLSAAAGESPVAKYHPTEKICSPQQRTTKAAKVPNLTSTKSSSCADDFEDWAVETHEWLNLLAMNSPRVFLEDSIDPFLSRYQVPEGDSKNAHSMVIVTWNGLIPASWIRQLLLETSAKYSKLEETPSLAFFALSAYAFETAMVDQQDGYTIMCSADSASSNNKETTVEVADGDEKAVDRRVKGYVLWEFTCD